MYRHGASQVSTNKRDLAIFWWDTQYFCLIIKQKAGWLVGIIVVKVFSVTPTWPHVAGYYIIYCGDWYFPDGDRLPFSGGGDIFEFRGYQRAELHRRKNGNSPVCIYHCDIPTNAVHDDNDISVILSIKDVFRQISN